MPLYHFICCLCGTKSRAILKPEEASARFCTCGSVLRRDVRPPNSQVMESLDNGAMPRRLERLADAERLFGDRNEIVKKKQNE